VRESDQSSPFSDRIAGKIKIPDFKRGQDWPVALCALSRCHLPNLLTSLRRSGSIRLCFVLLGLTGWSRLVGQIAPDVTALKEQTLALPKFEVSDHGGDGQFDGTGMGAQEEEMRSSPFSNDLTAVDLDMDESLNADTSAELSAISTSSPAAVVAGEERLNLRGFPTPILRNGFIQIGIMETLNIGKTIVIQGPLVPVLGRAAPGGIQNFLTMRPQARDRDKIEASFSTDNRQRLGVESTGIIKKDKLWQRVAVNWSDRTGPEDFVKEQDLALSGALTLKHSRAASSMLSIDYRQLNSHVTPGIPEYKYSADQKIIGPYLPLALFNANGPDAGVLRESLVIGAQFESQLTRKVSLRAAVEGWWRAIDQNRFTSSQLVLDTGVFEGIREPRHVEQRQHALATHLELTGRFRTAGIEHKLLGGAGITWGDYNREERALSTGERDELPLSVRRFDPAAPDYSFPEFDPAVYSRALTDRVENTRYTSAEMSDRVAFGQGRTVLTAGLRFDEVDLAVDDRRPAAPFPHTRDGTMQLSYHWGVNHQIIQNRLLLFTSASTAFDPSTPVDARTGRIQDNENTLGYEGGLKGRSRSGLFDYSSSVFLLYNRNIARRNPLYDDPVFDADQTQPQLVAAGEERFTGGRMEVHYKLSESYLVAFRAVHMEAVTTESPALGQEVGKQLARLPEDTATLLLRHMTLKEVGFTWSSSLSYIGSYVGNYEDAKRAYLTYPGYGLLSLSGGYNWKFGERQFYIGLALRNALDRDLLATNARVGADRTLSISMRTIF
jgi:iron complex outermembrane recepter protein